jgi:Domain of unknown function (DUF2017)
MGYVFSRRKRDGLLVCTLPEPYAELLKQIVRELAEMIAAPPPGDVTDRLFPRAYLDPTEEDSEQEWQSLVHDDLVRAKAEALQGVLVDLNGAHPAGRERVAVELDEEGEGRWLTVLNDARLTLGTVLGVTEESSLDFPPDDPRAIRAEIYEVLTELQGDLVEVLLDEQPEAGTAGEPEY